MCFTTARVGFVNAPCVGFTRTLLTSIALRCKETTPAKCCPQTSRHRRCKAWCSWMRRAKRTSDTSPSKRSVPT